MLALLTDSLSKAHRWLEALAYGEDDSKNESSNTWVREKFEMKNISRKKITFDRRNKLALPENSPKEGTQPLTNWISMVALMNLI